MAAGNQYSHFWQETNECSLWEVGSEPGPWVCEGPDLLSGTDQGGETRRWPETLSAVSGNGDHMAATEETRNMSQDTWTSMGVLIHRGPGQDAGWGGQFFSSVPHRRDHSVSSGRRDTQPSFSHVCGWLWVATSPTSLGVGSACFGTGSGGGRLPGRTAASSERLHKRKKSLVTVRCLCLEAGMGTRHFCLPSPADSGKAQAQHHSSEGEDDKGQCGL